MLLLATTKLTPNAEYVYFTSNIRFIFFIKLYFIKFEA